MSYALDGQCGVADSVRKNFFHFKLSSCINPFMKTDQATVKLLSYCLLSELAKSAALIY